MLLFTNVLGLNCFGSAITVLFNKQDGTVRFEANVSSTLPASERMICQNLSGMHYSLTVMIGNARFVLPLQTFKISETINLRVSCEDENSGMCQYSSLRLIQIATFKMTFIESDIEISGPAGKFQFRWFDRTDCNEPGIIRYQVVDSESRIDFQLIPRSTCELVPATDMLQLQWLVNGVEMLAINESFSAFATSRDGISRFSVTENYVQYLTDYQFSCAGLLNDALTACIAKIEALVNDHLAKIELVMKTRYTAENIDPTTGLEQEREYYQQINTIFGSIFSTIDNGCFDSSMSKIAIFNGSIRRQGATGTLNNCSHKVFSRMFDYANIRVEYGFVQNADFSGQKQRFLLDYKKYTCPYNFAFDRFVTCDTSADKQGCLDSLIKIRDMQRNATSLMTHYFQDANHQSTQTLSFPLIWEKTPLTYVNVYLFVDQICIMTSEIEEYSSYYVTFTLSSGNTTYTFQSDVKLQVGVQQYCTAIDASNAKVVKQLGDIQPSALTQTIQFDTYKMPVTAVRFFAPMQKMSYLWLSILVSIVSSSLLFVSGCRKRCMKEASDVSQARGAQSM